MTIQTQTGKAVYIADGLTVSFTIPFYFFDKQIAVYCGTNPIPLIEGADYTLNGANEPTGGEVVFTTAPQSGSVITIVRQVELTQLIQFIEGEKFPARDYEYSLDKIIMALQQIHEKLEDCLKIPYGLSMDADDVTQLLIIIDTYIEEIKQIPQFLQTIENLQTEIEEQFSHYYNKTQVDTLIDNVTTLCYTDVTVDVSDIVSDSTYEDYPYKVDIVLANVKETHIPEVCFNLAEATSGNFAPIAVALNNGVRLYMKQIPENDFSIASVILH